MHVDNYYNYNERADYKNLAEFRNVNDVFDLLKELCVQFKTSTRKLLAIVQSIFMQCPITFSEFLPYGESNLVAKITEKLEDIKFAQSYQIRKRNSRRVAKFMKYYTDLDLYHFDKSKRAVQLTFFLFLANSKRENVVKASSISWIEQEPKSIIKLFQTDCPMFTKKFILNEHPFLKSCLKNRLKPTIKKKVRFAPDVKSNHRIDKNPQLTKLIKKTRKIRRMLRKLISRLSRKSKKRKLRMNNKKKTGLSSTQQKLWVNNKRKTDFMPKQQKFRLNNIKKKGVLHKQRAPSNVLPTKPKTSCKTVKCGATSSYTNFYRRGYENMRVFRNRKRNNLKSSELYSSISESSEDEDADDGQTKTEKKKVVKLMWICDPKLLQPPVLKPMENSEEIAIRRERNKYFASMRNFWFTDRDFLLLGCFWRPKRNPDKNTLPPFPPTKRYPRGALSPVIKRKSQLGVQNLKKSKGFTTKFNRRISVNFLIVSKIITNIIINAVSTAETRRNATNVRNDVVKSLPSISSNEIQISLPIVTEIVMNAVSTVEARRNGANVTNGSVRSLLSVSSNEMQISLPIVAEIVMNAMSTDESQRNVSNDSVSSLSSTSSNESNISQPKVTEVDSDGVSIEETMINDTNVTKKSVSSLSSMPLNESKISLPNVTEVETTRYFTYLTKSGNPFASASSSETEMENNIRQSQKQDMFLPVVSAISAAAKITSLKTKYAIREWSKKIRGVSTLSVKNKMLKCFSEITGKMYFNDPCKPTSFGSVSNIFPVEEITEKSERSLAVLPNETVLPLTIENVTAPNSIKSTQSSSESTEKVLLSPSKQAHELEGLKNDIILPETLENTADLNSTESTESVMLYCGRIFDLEEQVESTENMLLSPLKQSHELECPISETVSPETIENTAALNSIDPTETIMLYCRKNFGLEGQVESIEKILLSLSKQSHEPLCSQEAFTNATVSPETIENTAALNSIELTETVMLYRRNNYNLEEQVETTEKILLSLSTHTHERLRSLEAFTNESVLPETIENTAALKSIESTQTSVLHSLNSFDAEKQVVSTENILSPSTPAHGSLPRKSGLSDYESSTSTVNTLVSEKSTGSGISLRKTSKRLSLISSLDNIKNNKGIKVENSKLKKEYVAPKYKLNRGSSKSGTNLELITILPPICCVARKTLKYYIEKEETQKSDQFNTDPLQIFRNFGCKVDFDHILGHLMYVFIGIEGAIFAKDKCSGYYKIADATKSKLMKHEMVMLLRILELGYYHDCLNDQMNQRAALPQMGLIGQAFIAMLREELDRYYSVVNMLRHDFQEQDFQKQICNNKFQYVQCNRWTLLKLFAWHKWPLERLRWCKQIVDMCVESQSPYLILPILFECLHHGNPLYHSLTKQAILGVCSSLNRFLVGWLVAGCVVDNTGLFFVECKSNEGVSEWYDKYAIVAERLPPYIDKELAEKVLQTGKCIGLLHGISFDKIPVRDKSKLEFAFTIGCEEYIDMCDNSTVSYLIDCIYGDVAHVLLDVCHYREQMLSLVEIMRDYILLCHGQFVNAFMEALEPHLDRSANEFRQLIIMPMLLAALTSTNFNHVKPEILEQIQIRVQPTIDSRSTGWDVLTLEYKLNDAWTDLLRPSLELYRQLFQRIWVIHHMEFVLTMNIWKSQMLLERQTKQTDVMVRNLSLVLRQLTLEMLHFVHEMQYYVFNEVIECAWIKVHPQIKQANSMDIILRSHMDYLHQVKRGVLLQRETEDFYVNAEDIYATIKRLKVWHQEFMSVRFYEDAINSVYSVSNLDELEQIEMMALQFEEKVKCKAATKTLAMKLDAISKDFERALINILLALQTSHDDKLLSLSYRLDYNDYYKKRDSRLCDPLSFRSMRKSELQGNWLPLHN